MLQKFNNFKRVRLGTRFRPLQSKPLFPVAGQPLIEHHIEQLCEVSFAVVGFITLVFAF